MGRILVVEDNSLNQLVAEGIVARLGYQVNIVSNGLQALTALASTSYSAVLMDCHMPIMDGFEAREIRRREDQNSNIPIIAMTAAAMPEDHERCLAAGMDDYLSTPIALRAVGEALRKWVRTDPTPEVDASGRHHQPWSLRASTEPALPADAERHRYVAFLGRMTAEKGSQVTLIDRI